MKWWQTPYGWRERDHNHRLRQKIYGGVVNTICVIGALAALWLWAWLFS